MSTNAPGGTAAISVKPLAVQVLPDHYRSPKAVVALELPGGIRLAVLCARYGSKTLRTQMPIAAGGGEGVSLPPALREAVHNAAVEAAMADPVAAAHFLRPQAEIDQVRAARRRGEAA